MIFLNAYRLSDMTFFRGEGGWWLCGYFYSKQCPYLQVLVRLICKTKWFCTCVDDTLYYCPILCFGFWSTQANHFVPRKSKNPILHSESNKCHGLAPLVSTHDNVWPASTLLWWRHHISRNMIWIWIVSTFSFAQSHLGSMKAWSHL